MDQALMPTQIEIASPRLRLVALDPRLAALQVDDRQAFFDAFREAGVVPWSAYLPDNIVEKFVQRVAATSIAPADLQARDRHLEPTDPLEMPSPTFSDLPRPSPTFSDLL